MINYQEIGTGTNIQRNASFNLEEIKVRWKKAALENCTGAPCSLITAPGPPTGVVATVGNGSVSVAFMAPTYNGGRAITGYTVTSNPATSPVTGTSSPINVTGLSCGTTYTFMVIATNEIGNSVASSASTAVTAFNCGTSTIFDFDGNTYNTVQIGTQCWTKQNLKVTKYNDCTLIPDETTSPGSNWAALTTGARTEYVGSILTSSGPAAITNYVGTYGYLYNWFAVVDSRKLCPTGWHVPSDSEWSILLNVLDINSNPNPGFPFIESSTAGGKMKDNIDWNGRPALGGLIPADPQATNSSGFSALPGGTRNITGLPGSYSSAFSVIGIQAFFQSSTPDSVNPLAAFSRNLVDSNSNVSRVTSFKEAGLSVRCIKD